MIATGPNWYSIGTLAALIVGTGVTVIKWLSVQIHTAEKNRKKQIDKRVARAIQQQHAIVQTMFAQHMENEEQLRRDDIALTKKWRKHLHRELSRIGLQQHAEFELSKEAQGAIQTQLDSLNSASGPVRAPGPTSP